MEEKINIINPENLEIINISTANEAHEKGLWHKIGGVFIFNKRAPAPNSCV